MARPKRATVLFVAAAILLVVGVVGTMFLSDEDESPRLITDDRIGDCREAGRDTGERCDVGADVESVALSVDGATLVVELAFLDPPTITDEILWTIQFFVESEDPVICGLSNVFGDAPPAAELTPYALDPATRDEVGPARCDGRLDGSDARFEVDLAGQPDDAEFRVLGSIILDFPENADVGSEDDFFVRTSLAAIRSA